MRIQRRSNRRLRIALGGIAVLLVAALTAGVLAVNAADQSERDAAVADASAVIADSRRLGAEALTVTEPDISSPCLGSGGRAPRRLPSVPLHVV